MKQPANKSSLTKENCVAFREFTIANQPGKKITLLIGKPQPHEKYAHGGGNFICEYRIVGNNIDTSYSSIGEDSVQALLLVFPVAASILESSGLKLLLWDSEDLMLPTYPEPPPRPKE